MTISARINKFSYLSYLCLCLGALVGLFCSVDMACVTYPFPCPCEASVVRVDVVEDVAYVHNMHLQKLMAIEPVASKLVGKQPWPWPMGKKKIKELIIQSIFSYQFIMQFSNKSVNQLVTGSFI